MTADLTREKIERLREDFDRGHDLGYGDQRALLAHALAEPARLAAARAEGVREGIEMAAGHLEARAAGFFADRDEHMRAWENTKGGQIEEVHARRACSAEATAASLLGWAAGLRSLAPAPAEEQRILAQRRFRNELAREIRITIEGPSSISENTLTPAEAAHLRDALVEAIPAPAEAPTTQTEASGEWIEWRGNEIEGADGPPIPKGQEYSIRSRASREMTLSWPNDELLSPGEQLAEARRQEAAALARVLAGGEDAPEAAQALEQAAGRVQELARIVFGSSAQSAAIFDASLARLGAGEAALHRAAVIPPGFRIPHPPAEAPTTPSAASDEWIEWKGGECPPAAVDVKAGLRFRDGREAETMLIRTYRWQHIGAHDDIIAYRIVQPTEASAPVAEGGAGLEQRVDAQHAVGFREGFVTAKERYAGRDPKVAALEAEVAALRRELEPLAREAERYDPPEGDGTEDLLEAWASRFTIGHLRRARALLQGGPDAG